MSTCVDRIGVYIYISFIDPKELSKYKNQLNHKKIEN